MWCSQAVSQAHTGKQKLDTCLPPLTPSTPAQGIVRSCKHGACKGMYACIGRVREPHLRVIGGGHDAGQRRQQLVTQLQWRLHIATPPHPTQHSMPQVRSE